MASDVRSRVTNSAIQVPAPPPIHPATTDLDPTPGQFLLSTLSSSAHVFLQPPPSLHAASLVLAKQYLDPLAISASEAQQRRLQYARKKRKRGESDGYDARQMLRMKQLHLDGFEIAQIWEQARRILDASRHEVERCLEDVALANENHGVALDISRQNGNKKSDSSLISADDDGTAARISDIEDEAVRDQNENRKDSEESILGELDRELVANSGQNSNEDPLHEEVDPEAKDEDIENCSDPGAEASSELNHRPRDQFIPDKHGLNDGFFSIDNFNKQSGLLEQQDARGGKDDEDASEEEIDWATDPLTMVQPRNKHRASPGNDEEWDSEEEDGPIFGDADSKASDADEGNPIDDISAMNNTNDVKYADFFDPPPRKTIDLNGRRALPKTQPPNLAPQPDKDDIQRTISAVRRDIFEDDLSPNDESSASDPDLPSRSNHQKRQAQISAEIRRLEAANVAKRDWTLSGEARAADRPINSLLEEDLEFERAGKPIPVITNEVSEDIESLIKRRILAREFDEVVRRRPGDLATGDREPGVRRGRFELDDTKPQQSLAEIYEAEHLKNADPEGYVDAKDSKLKAQHDAIEILWKDISAKLDALSSLHFKPKPPTATISVVADVPAITIEDARPSTGGNINGASMLAPQEVYKVGEGRAKAEKAREVVSKGGAIAAREELSREQKLRRRRREKERIRKAGGTPPTRPGDVAKGKKAKQKEVLQGLKSGGVRVIGKKGEIRDVKGKAVTLGAGKTTGKVGLGGGAYKL